MYKPQDTEGNKLSIAKHVFENECDSSNYCIHKVK